MAANVDLGPAGQPGRRGAVPVDIPAIDAHLTFDAAAQAAHGIASLAFVVGPIAVELTSTLTPRPDSALQAAQWSASCRCSGWDNFKEAKPVTIQV